MLAIDHIIIAAKDPAQAAQQFGDTYNCQVIEGGKHENWGTYNYLAYFRNNCYIEWLGIFDEDVAAQSDNPLIIQLLAALEKNKQEPIQYALRINQMHRMMEKLTKLNYSFIGPIAGERYKPDGTKLLWRMLFPTLTNPFPFFIEWGQNKNIPSDPKAVNDAEIQYIYDGLTDQHALKNIASYSLQGNDIPLSNGKLSFSSNNKISFSIRA